MKFPSAAAALVLAPSAAAAAAAALDCANIVAGEKQDSFDLSPLRGPHSVVVSEQSPLNKHNTTYTLDICDPLKRPDSVKEEAKCPGDTRVCAIRRLIAEDPDHDSDVDIPDRVFPVAGDLADFNGNALDPMFSLLETHSDQKGLRVVLNGGFHYENTQKRPQRAIVDFVCDDQYEGTEEEYKPEDEYVKAQLRREAPQDGDDKFGPPKEIQLGDPEKAALRYESFSPSDQVSNLDVLHLTWRTKHVCKKGEDDGNGGGDTPDDGDKGDDKGDGNDKNEGGGSGGGGPGWFGWLIIIILIGGAAYLIFGSWLNYTRYGARGWDLIPHGDTIRDIPYMAKDFTRRVLNTVQGSGSRGGYSAV